MPTEEFDALSEKISLLTDNNDNLPNMTSSKTYKVGEIIELDNDSKYIVTD